tara:strand:+ start:142 stop:876 length:735 start_codon:yes stop_codon:yes gene_type:complete
MSEEKKIVLITGASGGIGAACAELLARRNYLVALHFHSNIAKANKLASDLDGCKTFRYDLSRPEACENLVKDVKKEFGCIDLLLNNAGRSIDQLVPFVKPTDYEELMQVNLRPVFLLSKFVSKLMIRKKSGSIINITSVVGHTGNPGQSVYTATKSAITGFTKSIAFELAPFGIRCNCVAPGFVKTSMTDSLPKEVHDRILEKIPLKRFATPQDVAHAVYFLSSSEASYITGSTIHVNGGMYMS